RFVGVLGLDIMLSDLKTMVEEMNVQKNGRVILLNKENQVIVNQFDDNGAEDDGVELKSFDLFDPKIGAGEKEDFLVTLDDGRQYYISETENHRTGWKLFIALPYEEVMAKATESIRYVIFIDMLLMLLLSVVIGFLSNVIIIHPLETMVGVMKRLEHGDFSARARLEKNDEFGIMAEQFNRLIEIVHDYRMRLEEKVRRRTEENAALQQENLRLRIIEEKERIYGYLHDSLGARLTNIFISTNVAQSAVGKDAEVLQNMLAQIERNTQSGIEDLKEILNSSQNEERKMIDFPKVLEHNIGERLRLKQIELEFTVRNPEIINDLERERRFEIEKILQELVSNVLKHSGAARVRLSLQAEEGGVRIFFEDDGVGLGADLRELVSQSPSFGLKNMKQRIQNYGGSFEIFSGEKEEPPFGVRVVIFVPTEQAAEGD
ncbi:MAG TPA: HAMP domain-containing protein, partial [Sediminispirochaeta sp.]|nr:HAMP domain-containing protein [Sediminispirochaeta sp.]